MKRFALFVFFFLSSQYSFAEEFSHKISQFKQAALEQKLYINEEWLALVHYRPNRVMNGYVSQADDDSFFISEDGKYDPEAELIATIDLLLADNTSNLHCQFPARRHWLLSEMKQQGLLNRETPSVPAFCKDYYQWLEAINTKTITLVFASSYLNSPSSMFGHTFLRLDQPGQDKDNLLLANTISYAADAGERDNELMFAYRGIFGGYPGITSIEPYYDKIKLYSHLENRDLWEYQLNLTDQETMQLLRAAWEVKDKRFDYYFFDENCAYRILALIDIARPGTNLLDEITYRAIPSDTVRLVVDKSLVSSIVYRPSSATDITHKIAQLTTEEQTLVDRILTDGLDSTTRQVLLAYNTEDQAQILDTAFDYLRYQAIEEEHAHEESATLSHQILIARSQLKYTANLSPPSTPTVRDDQGHETLRLSLSAGEFDHDRFVQFTVRPAYHDLSDPIEGYQPGAQLQFMRTDFRYYTEQSTLEVERFVGVEVMSLTPRDAFFKPVSWQVGFGGRRVFAGEKRVFAPYLEGGAGLSYKLLNGIGYGLITGDLEIDSSLGKGFNLGPGAIIGWAYQGTQWQAQVGLKTIQFLEDEQHNRDRLFFSQSLTLSKALSLNLNATREREQGRYTTEWGVEARYYY